MKEAILSCIELSLLNLVQPEQIWARDAVGKALENDLDLLSGPFTVFHASSFRFPRSSDSTLFGS